jgi:hypothetical protein
VFLSSANPKLNEIHENNEKLHDDHANKQPAFLKKKSYSVIST